MCNKNARMKINVQLAGKCAKIPALISPLRPCRLVFPHVTFHGISIPHVRSQGRVMEMVEWNGNAVGASIWLYLRLIPSRHDGNTLPATSLMHAQSFERRVQTAISTTAGVTHPYTR